MHHNDVNLQKNRINGLKYDTFYIPIGEQTLFVKLSARQKLKKNEVANEQAEQTGQFSQAEVRMRKTQQVILEY